VSWTYHHVNVPSSDVRRDAAFLTDLVGLRQGLWTYPDGHGDLHHGADGIAYFGVANLGLHVVRVVPSFAHERGFEHNPTVGGHPALNIDDLAGVMERAREAGLPLTDAGTYAMRGTHQAYVFDPAANLIEVNQTVEPFPEERRAEQDEAAAVAIRAVILPAHDLDRSTAFYEEVVGLGVAEWGQGAASFAPNGHALHLALPDIAHPARHNPTLKATTVVGVADLDAAAARLGAAGHPLSDVDDPVMGGRVVYTLTPSAEMIGLVAA
jgi:catechol 2,3-dioxygenase-like lactoylglutathione lyase family enzyme